MLPIPDTADLSPLKENVAAASVAITDAERERAASLVT
jgi:hypothetical protein